MPKILAIDDIADNLTTLSALLKNLMPECLLLTAQSGAEGIEKVGKESPDTILLDINMPEMDGFEVCKKLKSDKTTRNIPIILLTAIQTDSKSRVKGLNLGADAFLSKPIDESELVAQVNVMLRIKKSEDLLYKEKDLLEDLVQERTATLLESEKTLLDLKETVPVGISITSPDGSVNDVNSTVLKIFGFDSKEEFFKIPASCHYYDEKERARFKEQLKNGLVKDFEAQFIRKDGTVFWGSITSLPRTTPTGAIQYINAFQDISVRKQAEETLRESEERYKCLFENMTSGVAVYEAVDNGEDFVFKNFNRAGEKIENVDRKNIIGKRVTEAFAGVKKFGIFDVFKKVWKTGQSEYFPEAIYKDKRDSGTWRESWVYKLPSGEIVSVYNDITDRKKAEKALIKSKEKYQDLYDNAPDMYISVDVKTKKIVECNQTTLSELGYTKEEIIGQPVFNMYTPDSAEYAKKNIFPVFVKTGIIEGEELQLRRKNGSVLEILLKVSSNRDSRGNIIQSRSSWRDITAIKNAEEDNRKLQDQLTQVQKLEAIGTLAGGIAHDFNNILSSILGFTEIARLKSTNNEELDTELDEILTAGLRARDLVKHILTFSRSTSNIKELIDIGPLIKEAAKFLRASLPNTIDIKCETDKFQGTVMSSPVEIHQIIMNLCTNAGYAMKDTGGLLEIFLDNVQVENDHASPYTELKKGDYVRIKISDTGTGMSKEIINQIFTPFFTTKKREEGSGFGLSVVHGIVKDMGGAITVDSEPEKGSTLHVLLPKQEEKDFDSYFLHNKPREGKGKILLVDDEESIIVSSSQILRTLGYEVVTSNSSFEALEQFKAKPEDYDLVLTDMTMPKMTGLELSKKLKNIKSDIPILLSTGFSADITDRVIMDAGIHEMVMKPMVASELSEAIHRALKAEKV